MQNLPSKKRLFPSLSLKHKEFPTPVSTKTIASFIPDDSYDDSTLYEIDSHSYNYPNSFQPALLTRQECLPRSVSQTSYSFTTPLSNPLPTPLKTPSNTTQTTPIYSSYGTPHPHTSLVSTNVLPRNISTFFKFPTFNAMQSECFNSVFHSDSNLVVSSPTGSGKTVIMELAILRVLMTHSMDNIKMVYMAPTKALCTEKSNEWKSSFGKLGLVCVELTGDSEFYEQKEIRKAHIIVTTPEKWDSTTRKWKDSKQLFSLLKLFMVDEIHTLKEETRGATLEVVIGRMKSFSRNVSSSGIRLIAMSATVPNLSDISIWLKNRDGSPAIMKTFGEEFRPVKLDLHVLGFPCTGNEYMFDRFLDSKLSDVVSQYSHGKPALVFCSTRKSVISSAESLVSNSQSTNYNTFVISKEQSSQLTLLQSKLVDRKLGEMVRFGIAFHHGGLSYGDRSLIENAFIQGWIQIICATSTLAVGVNLPAHLVIIKSTMQYLSGMSRDYSELDITQMLGRAGRPQYDTSGVAVIMTSMDKKAKYDDMVYGREIIESCLADHLVEHLNAEIVLETISHVSEALDWLQSTFLHVRILQNPNHYSFLKTNTRPNANANQELDFIISRDLEFLHSNHLISMDMLQKTVKPTAYGRIMAKYYIKAHTMIHLLQMKKGAGLKDVLETLCLAQEFPIKFQSDKAILNELNKSNGIRFPIKGRIIKLEQKINLLLQCALGSIEYKEKFALSMANETNLILQHGHRIIKCIIDICLERGDVISLKNSIILGQCLNAKSWENSMLLLKQIEGIGPNYAKMLSNVNINSFEKLLKADARELEFRLNRNPPFGNKILDAAAKFPIFKLSVFQVKSQVKPQVNCNSTRSIVELSVAIALENVDSVKSYDHKRMLCATCLVYTSGDLQLCFQKRISLMKLKQSDSFSIKVELKRANQKIICGLMSDDYVGLDVICTVEPELFDSSLVSLPPHLIDDASQGVEIQDNDFDNDDEYDYESIFKSCDELALSTPFSATPYASLSNTLSHVNSHVKSHTNSHLNSHTRNEKEQVLYLPSQTIPIHEYHSCQDSPLEQDYMDELMNSQDDLDLIVKGQVQVGPKQRVVEQAKSNNGNTQEMVPCAHSCLNKQTCSHLCCKTGITLKASLKRKKKNPSFCVTDQLKIESALENQSTQSKQGRCIDKLERFLYKPDTIDNSQVITLSSSPKPSVVVESNPTGKKRKKMMIESLEMASDPVTVYDILYKPVSPLIHPTVEESLGEIIQKELNQNEIIKDSQDSLENSIDLNMNEFLKDSLLDEIDELSDDDKTIDYDYGKEETNSLELESNKEDLHLLKSVENTRFNVPKQSDQYKERKKEMKKMEIPMEIESTEDLSVLLYDLI